MIERVSFTNYKALRRVDVELDRLTVFAGANSSGKTSVLDGIHSFEQIAARGKPAADHNWRDAPALYTRGGTGPMVVAVEGRDVSARTTETPPSWACVLEVREGDGEWRGSLSLPAVATPLRSAFLRLDPLRMAAASYSHDERPRMTDRGDGLASTLAWLALQQPERFVELQRLVTRVVPAVRRIRFERAAVRRYRRERVTVGANKFVSRTPYKLMGDRLVFDLTGAAGTPAGQVSEGTLIAVGILAAATDSTHGVVLIDDIDRGLHPRGQRALVAVFRELLAAMPQLQIIATTHSPYLLDELDPSEVRLMTLRDDGSAACAPLERHPEFARWTREMQPGELWSVFGEAWAADVAANGAH